MDAINPSVELTEQERIDRLRLIRSDNVGPRKILAQAPRVKFSFGGTFKVSCP